MRSAVISRRMRLSFRAQSAVAYQLRRSPNMSNSSQDYVVMPNLPFLTTSRSFLAVRPYANCSLSEKEYWRICSLPKIETSRPSFVAYYLGYCTVTPGFLCHYRATKRLRCLPITSDDTSPSTIYRG